MRRPQRRLGADRQGYRQDDDDRVFLQVEESIHLGLSCPVALAMTLSAPALRPKIAKVSTRHRCRSSSAI
jgi:hypothetical protein